VKFCAALQNFWILRGYASEGRTAVRSALGLPDVQASEMAQAFALIVGACLAESQSDHSEAQEMLETCLVLRRKMSNPVDIASTLTMLSPARLQAGDVAGATQAEAEALALFCQSKHRLGEMISLVHLGQIETYARNDDKAREHLERAISIAKETRHQEAEAACELALAETAYESGDPVRAYVRATRSLAVCTAAADKRGEVSASWWLGRLDLQSGNLEQAGARLRDALRGFRTFEMRAELLSCIEDHAVLACRSSAHARAAKLAAAAAALRKRLGLARSPRAEQRWTAELDALRNFAPDVFERGWLEGEAWDLEQAMSGALAAH
jgi:tetratricopeptide (TPR) repeat protein